MPTLAGGQRTLIHQNNADNFEWLPIGREIDSTAQAHVEILHRDVRTSQLTGMFWVTRSLLGHHRLLLTLEIVNDTCCEDHGITWSGG
jgi:hypothetical protein